MSLPKAKAWFPSKKHGYGYSFPTRWQGWLVLAVYVALVSAGAPYAETHPLDFAACMIVLTMLFGAVCAWKGEAPEWRWGRTREGENLKKARAGFRAAAALIALAFLGGIIYAGIQIGAGNHHLHVWVLVLFGAMFYPEFLSIAIKGDGFLLLNSQRIQKNMPKNQTPESDGQAD